MAAGEPPAAAMAEPSAAPAASNDDGGLPVLPRANPLDEVLDEPEDELAPFAVEIGRGPAGELHQGVVEHRLERPRGRQRERAGVRGRRRGGRRRAPR